MSTEWKIRKLDEAYDFTPELLKIVVVAFLLVMATGCVGLITGVKSYETKESRTEFITGADLGISFNAVDNVKNQRGIEPSSNGLFKK